MQKLSKGFFLTAIAVGFGLIDLFLLVEAGTPRAGAPDPTGSALGLAMLLAIGVAVVLLVLVYKMWAAIQDGYARTTPGKAAALLCLPLFNLYWVFQAFWGFAKDYNRFVERHAVPTPHLPEGLFLAYAMLGLLTWLPTIGLGLLVVHHVLGVLMVAKICDGVNALPTQLEASASVTAPDVAGSPASSMRRTGS